MVKRVLLNSNGLKISKTGIDVTTAQPGDYIFDSNYGHLRIWYKGSFNWLKSDPSDGTRNFYYPGGRVFAQPPLAAYYFGGEDRDSFDNPSPVPLTARVTGLLGYHLRVHDSVGDASFEYTVMALTDRIYFNWESDDADLSDNLTIYYVVMDYDA